MSSQNMREFLEKYLRKLIADVIEIKNRGLELTDAGIDIMSRNCSEELTSKIIDDKDGN